METTDALAHPAAARNPMLRPRRKTEKVGLDNSRASYFCFTMSSPSTPESGPHDVSIETVNRRSKDIEDKLPKLKALLEQAKVMLSMVRDYWSGRYREIPYWAIGAMALALLYVLNPADLFPDFILGVGYLDDAAVVAFCLKLVEQELERYKQWLAAQAKEGKVIDV